MSSKKEYELAVKIAGMVDASLKSSVALTKKQLKSIAKDAAAANAETMTTEAALEKAAPAIDGAWKGLKTTVATVAKVAAAGGAALTAIGAASISTGKDFETAMSSWKATADANSEEFERARAAAMEMGRTTSKTAKDSANALEYMALAGWSVDDSIKGLPGVLRLSEATEMDLARASDLVTDSMSALGVQIDDLDGYLNIVAKANNKSNQTAEQLMEAYLSVGGTMKNLHVPLAESATALGVLANRGIKASEGGNAMNAVMINLTTGAGQAGKKMKELGISAFDSNGKFKGLKETLQTVNDAVSGLTEEERNAALSAIGGKEHVDALNSLLSGLNTTLEDGKSEWDNLNESLEHADGALEKMASTKMDNLEGDLEIMKSALQDAGIQIYDGLNEPLREGIQFATEQVYKFSGGIAAAVKEGVPTAKRELKQAAQVFEDFSKPVMAVGSWMLDHPDVIGSGIAAVAATITTAKVSQTLLTTAKAVKTLGAAMAGNPVLATVGVASVAVGAIAGIAAQAKIANEKLKKENLSEHFGTMSLSLSELDDVAGRIIDDGRLTKLSTAMEEFDKVKDIAGNLQKSQETMDKLNWKVQMGIELNADENSSYKSSLDQFVKDSIDLVEQQQYAMNLNLDVLFGGSEEGTEIEAQFNSYYEKQSDKLQELGKQLGEAYEKGMENGVLSMDETEVIQGIQQQMSDITNTIADAKVEASMETVTAKYSGVKLDADSFQNLQSEMQEKLDEASKTYEDSLSLNIYNAKMMLNGGDIDQSTYDDMVKTFTEQYQERMAEVQTKAGEFMTQTITSGWADEMGEALPRVQEALDGVMETAFTEMDNSDNLGEMYGDYFTEILTTGINAVNTEGLSEGSRAAIQQLLDNMAPTIQQMEEAKRKTLQAGKEVPKALADALKDVEMLELITGGADAIWSYTGEKIATSEEYTATYNKVKEVGGKLPPSLAQGIADKKKEIEPGINELYNHVKSYAQSKFRSPIDVSVNIKPSYTSTGTGVIPGHAEGGIFDQPHFGLLAEAGPEAYVPLDKSKRSVSIWQQAGQALGVLGGSGGAQPQQAAQPITYAPTYQIYGADEQTVRKATRDDQEQFEMMMARYLRDQQRLAF